jgi:hypothetical protein
VADEHRIDVIFSFTTAIFQSHTGLAPLTSRGLAGATTVVLGVIATEKERPKKLGRQKLLSITTLRRTLLLTRNRDVSNMQTNFAA